MNKNTKYTILALIIIVVVLPLLRNSYEAFTNLSPGKYPISEDVPLLNEYPLKKNMGLSNNTYEMNSSYYPIFGSSYGQHTNNVKYWATPNNGKCLRGFFCGGLYNNKKIDVPKTPPIIPFSSPAIRVNYYNSLEQIC